MSDEEKKAIERLSLKAITSSIEAPNYPNAIVMKKDLIAILNLIEKQSKEIEELKKKNKELYNPKDMILRYYDKGKGMQVEIKGFISKDKIKEIIYPTPENYISIEVQQSEMYKKLLKEVEE